ncbi:hypothetical protein AVEN_4010-1 [Araneus ventricosus]|uniref:Uncharacterized protein n=1 Tax=Araneus ventricosus TaxID=182803 RepID=A0A4Y2H6J2_ARAVE|nr:hypothetical protein AVEN_4010-1 [Araneus ventricosus]
MRRGRKVKSQGFVGWLTTTSNHWLSSHLSIGRGSKPKGFLWLHPGRPNSVRSFQLSRVMCKGMKWYFVPWVTVVVTLAYSGICVQIISHPSIIDEKG